MKEQEQIPIFNERLKDGLLRAFRSPDSTKLFIDLEAISQHADIGSDEVLKLLKGHVDPARLIVPVVEDAVAALRNGVAKVCGRKVVQTRSATKGEDGRIELRVKPFKPDDVSPGRAPLINISAGQVVGHLYPPAVGDDGEDIFGERIPGITGEKAPLVRDSSLSLIPVKEGQHEYEEIIAEKDGYLYQHGDSLRVSSTLTVQGDLDHHYGDIDFIGFVVVRGDVRADRSIRARQGIHIDRSFKGRSLISSEGNIYISEYVYGGEYTSILAGKSLTASLVQELNTEVIGNIYIRRDAQNCKLRTAGRLIMPEGLLLGGETHAVKGVEAKVIGSEAGITTRIHLSSDIEASMEYAKLNVDLERLDKERELLRLRLGPFANDRLKIQTLEPLQRARLLPIHRRLMDLEAMRVIIRRKLHAMLHQARYSKVLRVNFLDTMHEGTEIFCGSQVFKPEKTLEGPATVEFVIASRSFVLRDYQPLE